MFELPTSVDFFFKKKEALSTKQATCKQKIPHMMKGIE